MTIAAQKADLKKIQDAIGAANAKIAAVDTGLRLEVRNERIANIRRDALAQLEGISGEMEKRQIAAKSGIAHWSQPAVRRRAKFADDPALDAAQRVATLETLKRARTAELLEHLKDAIQSKSLAHAEAVRSEFHSRADSAKLGEDFSRLFAAVVDPQAKTMETELGHISGLADVARVLTREFSTGKAFTADRIDAYRAAGMAKVREPVDPAGRAAAMLAVA